MRKRELILIQRPRQGSLWLKSQPTSQMSGPREDGPGPGPDALQVSLKRTVKAFLAGNAAAPTGHAL